MPVFLLDQRISFPNVELASPEGLLAIGGDLAPERLLKAYSLGIFPWYSEGEPIAWWSPDPRFVLFPGEIRVPSRLQRLRHSGFFHCTCDDDFPAVISGCRQSRPGQDGTWITAEMAAAYLRLHELGYAHSVEAWHQDRLCGGLYGVALGRIFFGESMFHLQANASKIALIALVEKLRALAFSLIDCQVPTPHLEQFGARLIPRSQFLQLLASTDKSKREKW